MNGAAATEPETSGARIAAAERGSRTAAAERPASRPEVAKYRADIDGLRAVAVLAVLGFHAFPETVPGGFVGVDVFFVISGFLITGILLGGLERGTFSLREFYSRRVRRIFPALVVTMAACWVFGWFALFPDEYRQLGRHVAGGAGFVANFYYWFEAGYFDNAAETKPLLHLWSLGIEEQFYIVWPLLLWGTRRLGIGVLRWMPALALASFAVNVLGLDRHPTATFYSPASRAWELALGGLLAYAAARRPLPTAGAARAALASWAGLAAIALGVALVAEGDPFPGWLALLPTVGTALVVAAGPEAWVNRRLLAARPMVWIGLISYPLYLWHWPLLSFARIVESKTPALAIRVTALAVAFVLAALTYVAIERPFRFGGKARRKVWTLAAAMLVVGAAGRLVASSRGLPGRATVQAQLEHQKALVLRDFSANAEACKRRFGFDEEHEFCLLEDPAAPPTVALVGDSHAFHLTAGLAEQYRARGDNFLYLGTRVPFWGVSRRNDPYQSVTDGMLDIALGTPTVHTVIVATAQRLDDSTHDGRKLARAFERTLRRFLGAGKRVIVVKDVPELDFEPRECIRRAGIPSSTTRSPCALERSRFDAATAANDAVLRRVLKRVPAVELFDASAPLCDERRCWAMLDGKLLYRDRDHLSLDGDLLVGRRFASERLAGAGRR